MFYDERIALACDKAVVTRCFTFTLWINILMSDWKGSSAGVGRPWTQGASRSVPRHSTGTVTCHHAPAWRLLSRRHCVCVSLECEWRDHNASIQRTPDCLPINCVKHGIVRRISALIASKQGNIFRYFPSWLTFQTLILTDHFFSRLMYFSAN
jgi:hypothetical protein